MEKFKLDDMVKGWFIGNFEPSLFKTNDVEVGVKKYNKGDKELRHFHKISTEFTVIINGIIEMNKQRYKSGDIVVVRPGEASDFNAITDVITVVVKIPGANNDKFLVNE